MSEDETVEMFRPVGPCELARIHELGAEELDEFNSNIVGSIEVVAEYDGSAGGEPQEVQREADAPGRSESANSPQ